MSNANNENDANADSGRQNLWTECQRVVFLPDSESVLKGLSGDALCVFRQKLKVKLCSLQASFTS